MPAGWPLDIAAAVLIGLALGSFLNVVIHRLPKMMERQWAAECAELSGTAAPEAPVLNLWRPASRCGACGHAIRWHENIPLLSYLRLRGKCSACGATIGLRYPLVELATGLLFGWIVWKFGIGWSALAWCGYAATLLALACIDWDTTLLPDDLTLPLLWAGLIAASLQWTGVPLTHAVWGAAAGYGSLWLICFIFLKITGKQGMGHGDFKLFAALGAWFGWPALVPIILLSSVIGAAVGIVLKLRGGLREGGYLPFGPFLAGAGLAAMLLGPDAVLRWVGL